MILSGVISCSKELLKPTDGTNNAAKLWKGSLESG